MTSSLRSKCKAKYIGPCFYDYLDGLREEFELSLAKNPRPRRFATYLDGLKFEFELMTEDIESVSKERDELRVKVQAPNDSVCQRCSKGTSGTSRNIASTPLKTLESVSASPSRLVIQSKSPGKLNTSSPVNLSRNTSRNVSSSPLKNSKAKCSPSPVGGARSRPLQKPAISSRVVKPPQQTLRSPTQRVTIPQRIQSTATSTTASVSDTYSISQPLEPMNTYPETVTLPPPLPQTPACPTTSFGNELRVGIAHAISHKEAVLCVNFSQDGKYIAAGCQDGKSYIYDVETATLIQVLRDLLVEKDVIVTVRFSRDGKYLATGSSSGSIYVWKINTKYVRNAFKGYTSRIRSLDFSPNGRVVVSTSDSDSFVRLWNMRDGAAKDLTDGNIRPYYSSAVFSPGGEYVAASHRDGMVRVWHVCTGQLMRRVKAHKYFAFDVGFTPDGKGLVSGGGDNSLKYWDISPWITTFVSGRSQTSERVCVPEEEFLPEREYSSQLHAGRSLSISPDGRWVAFGSVDALVGIWDIHSGVMQYTNLHHYQCVYSVDFSPAGDYLASSEYDGTVKIWRYAHIAPGGIQGHP